MAFNIDEDYERVIELTNEVQFDDSDAWANPILFRMVSLLLVGQFEEMLRNMEAVDAPALAVQLGMPADALGLSLVYQVAGDDQSAEENIAIVRASRELENLSTGFAQNASLITEGRVLYGGYTLEAYGQTVTANAAYQLALRTYPNNYLINWRRGLLLLQSSRYQDAYRALEAAYNNAPVPFPIAAYQMATLALDYPDTIETSRGACELLDSAFNDTQSSPEFYAPLIEKIQVLQETHCSPE
jgi:tetratricopeptide (TPR) repeat protein